MLSKKLTLPLYVYLLLMAVSVVTTFLVTYTAVDRPQQLLIEEKTQWNTTQAVTIVKTVIVEKESTKTMAIQKQEIVHETVLLGKTPNGQPILGEKISTTNTGLTQATKEKTTQHQEQELTQASSINLTTTQKQSMTQKQTKFTLGVTLALTKLHPTDFMATLKDGLVLTAGARLGTLPLFLTASAGMNYAGVGVSFEF